MAKAMTKTEFAYLRELVENYHGPKKLMVKRLSNKTGRSVSCLQYVKKAKTFEEYVKIRPEPHFKKPAGQMPLGTKMPKPVAKPVAAPKVAKPASDPKTVDGDRLIETLKQNMAEANVMTKMTNEQTAKLAQSNYVVSNSMKSLTLAVTALNRDQWVRFVILILMVCMGMGLLTMPIWK